MQSIRPLLARALRFTVYVPFRLVGAIYWWFVRTMVRTWGARALHAIQVGEISGGPARIRSVYREDMLLRSFLLFTRPRGKTLLDLGCNDGYWSLRLARFGLSGVVGIDKNPRTVFRANFFKHVHGYPSFEYRTTDLFEYLYGPPPRRFDIVLLLSVIYHLPESIEYRKFFGAISAINDECLIIDTRWFENDDYWHDKTGSQAFISRETEQVKKWRPTRAELVDVLRDCGYEEVVEVQPAGFLADPDEAMGDGNPYALENVADYVTGNRSVFFAYKRKGDCPDSLHQLEVKRW